MKTNPRLKTVKLAAASALVVVVGWGLSVRPAQAQTGNYVLTLQQVGSNVVATGTGAIDLTNLADGGPSSDVSYMNPSHGKIQTGPTSSTPFEVYSGVITGPLSFGSGGLTAANSGSGDWVGIAGRSGLVFVPTGYVSGTALSDSATYDSATFSTLGLTPGVYEWTWGSGADQNFTLDIQGVPEPATWLAAALIAIGLSLHFFTRRRAA